VIFKLNGLQACLKGVFWQSLAKQKFTADTDKKYKLVSG
jgi:hypothetical protein